MESDEQERVRRWNRWDLQITGLALIIAMVIGFSQVGWTRTSALALTISGGFLILAALDLARRWEARRHKGDPSARVHSHLFWTVVEIGALVGGLIVSMVMWLATYGELPVKVWLPITGIIVAVVAVAVYVHRRAASAAPAATDD